MKQFTPITPCPVFENSQNVLNVSGDMTKAMRKLRRSLNHCHDCSKYEDCTIWQQFRAHVDSAIASVVDEWGLVQP